MNSFSQLKKEVAILAAAVFIVAAGLPIPARAQLCCSGVETLEGSVTKDQRTEDSVGDMDLNLMPQIVAALTTTSQGAQYAPNSQFIASLDQVMFAGVNPQNDGELFPVTQGLPCDSYDPMITQIAPALMKTYTGALANTQTLTTALQNINLSAISVNIQSPYPQTTLQGIGQAVLALTQAVGLEQAQTAQLTTVVATHDLYQLDATVRILMPRQGNGCQ
jgi:hypothetical protein